jgi:hypothetical protein
MLSIAIGIKNAILIVLIVLIIHFAVKNAIINRDDKLAITPENKKTKETFSPSQLMVKEPTCMPQSPNDNLESEKEKLLQFVFGKDIPKDSKGLDAFFKDYTNQIAQCDKPYEQCTKKSDDHQVPLATTCDPNIQEIPLLPDMEKATEVCNTKKDLMILNQYNNENPMNGGTLYADISPFDDYDMSYEQYACGIKTLN